MACTCLTGAMTRGFGQSPADVPRSAVSLNAIGAGFLPGLLGIEIVDWADGEVTGRLPIRSDLFAPNGFVHAGGVVALADTLCGYGCVTSLPDGATGFTTVDLTTSLMRAVRDGALVGRASRVHSGRSTQIWDATVTTEGEDRPVALFRCTQLVLWPR
jgi:1,4-dihydroxy-2-naphthoyl-CoA hydrolase